MQCPVYSIVTKTSLLSRSIATTAAGALTLDVASSEGKVVADLSLRHFRKLAEASPEEVASCARECSGLFLNLLQHLREPGVADYVELGRQEVVPTFVLLAVIGCAPRYAQPPCL